MKKVLAFLGHAAAVAAPTAVFAAKHPSEARVCTLTGKQVEPCCCVEDHGKLVCTLTGQTLDECCCK